MRLFFPLFILFYTYQVHAGDFIILDSYYLERVERQSSDKANETIQMEDARGPVEKTHIEVSHRNRNISDITIRRNKSHRINNNKNDSPLLQYQF